jgi:Flp pilus assembly pilin Flp
MIASIRTLLTDRRGVGAIEYALVASLISVAAIAAFVNLGDSVDREYQDVGNKL